MILAFINELDALFLKEQGDNNYFTLHGLIMKNDDIVEEKKEGTADMQTEPIHRKTKTQALNPPQDNSPSVNKPFDNSFEAKYLQFKDRIEKDRLAWEILANRK